MHGNDVERSRAVVGIVGVRPGGSARVAGGGRRGRQSRRSVRRGLEPIRQTVPPELRQTVVQAVLGAPQCIDHRMRAWVVQPLAMRNERDV